jgi:hypothetical protein
VPVWREQDFKAEDMLVRIELHRGIETGWDVEQHAWLIGDSSDLAPLVCFLKIIRRRRNDGRWSVKVG